MHDLGGLVGLLVPVIIERGLGPCDLLSSSSDLDALAGQEVDLPSDHREAVEGPVLEEIRPTLELVDELGLSTLQTRTCIKPEPDADHGQEDG